MEKETTLYIPSNVKTRSEIFDGYGKHEVIQTLIAAAFITAAAFLIFSFNHSVPFLVVFIMAGIAASVICTTKDKYNQSVVDHAKSMIRFAREQQDFKYKYQKEWGDV